MHTYFALLYIIILFRPCSRIFNPIIYFGIGNKVISKAVCASVDLTRAVVAIAEHDVSLDARAAAIGGKIELYEYIYIYLCMYVCMCILCIRNYPSIHQYACTAFFF